MRNYSDFGSLIRKEHMRRDDPVRLRSGRGFVCVLNKIDERRERSGVTITREEDHQFEMVVVLLKCAHDDVASCCSRLVHDWGDVLSCGDKAE